VVTAAVAGVALAAGMWWTYFDVGSIKAARALAAAPPGRIQNEMARDGYSYLHFPMVAGIVLVALGLGETLAHIGEHLDAVHATALAGGLGLFVLAQVAFKLRVLGTISYQRIIAGVVLVAAIPIVMRVPAIVAVIGAVVIVWVLVVFETVHFAAVRDEVRHGSGPQEG
jgi:low temperature requirement protein LtrA